jgi:hypothetical protein
MTERRRGISSRQPTQHLRRALVAEEYLRVTRFESSRCDNVDVVVLRLAVDDDEGSVFLRRGVQLPEKGLDERRLPAPRRPSHEHVRPLGYVAAMWLAVDLCS